MGIFPFKVSTKKMHNERKSTHENEDYSSELAVKLVLESLKIDRLFFLVPHVIADPVDDKIAEWGIAVNRPILP